MAVRVLRVVERSGGNPMIRILGELAAAIGAFIVIAAWIHVLAR